MEKFYIVTEESSIYKDYNEYEQMSEKVNKVFKEFAKEIGIETTEYYQSATSLHIVPTTDDRKKFAEELKKDNPGLFKKTSKYSKMWLEKCKEHELKTPNKPYLPFLFDGFGKSHYRLFKMDGALYASYERAADFSNPSGFIEIKASEFYRLVEEHNERVESLKKL